MTMNIGFGFDAELKYRQERLRADFRRAHGTNRPRWWRRRPAAAAVAHRTTTPVLTPVRTLRATDAGAVTTNTVDVVPVPAGHRAHAA